MTELTTILSHAHGIDSAVLLAIIIISITYIKRDLKEVRGHMKDKEKHRNKELEDARHIEVCNMIETNKETVSNQFESIDKRIEQIFSWIVKNGKC